MAAWYNDLEVAVGYKTSHKMLGALRGNGYQMLLKRPFGSKRAAQGLYGGKDIGFGNNVSHSERKTRRSWKPNVQSKKLWSETLEEFIHFRITTYALRCIDKAGGLDNYLLNTPPAKLKSTRGEAAKQRILEAKELHISINEA